MDTIKNHMDTLYDKARQYAETTLELYKLRAISITADVVSSILSRIALFIIGCFFFLFVNIAISLFIGKEIGGYYLGFLIVSGFYLLVGVLLYLYNDKLMKEPITDLIIAKLLKSEKIDDVESNTEKDELL